MNNKTQDLLDRTFNFGFETLKLLNELPYNPVYSVVIKQLARSSTSIGANYEEAQAAESKKDFVHKIGISAKESRETTYWLKMTQKLYEDSDKNIEILNKIDEANELKKIFTSIKISSQKNIK
jgi:four helix bundle protein